ncbi:death domain-associated protein 6 [Bufo bufo]|uniref:death domain-associated protein 6 n=1 Tax=Bufo bufo TaxID=8384 RepID=UPI001ABED7B1|nr:death domain-associated protein 6 [Bufo bufo]XP_040298541.1 death domain-associated protein 6 [Bufo bufo]XP_040298542.1 death domain-associated protein 6 [Bufo bufo]XP_040298544.1 death domain-associated protein 6 [Bufo bufo]
MSHVKEIIVLDDDEDEEEPPRPTKAKATACNSSKQTNGKQEGSSSQPSKAQAISAENKKLFNEFVEYCSKWTPEHPEVISFLQGRYVKANPSYLSSVEFRNTLGRCLSRVQTKRSKIFVYINELCTALKANSQKRKVSLQTQAIQPAATEKADTPKESDAEAEDAPAKKIGSKRQIRYLENLLRTYSQEINKLQEKELSLEDLEDEDSTYIQESRLKRKLLRIFDKLCELKDCSSFTGRVIEQRILYRGTRYPEINRRLEKFINSTRDLFPDYGDILRLVERANDKHSLGLSRKQMQSMSQDAFRELGNKLQDRRHLDMIYNFGCHLTDPYKSVNDPAQQDTSLSRRLRENRNTAMSRLDDVIKKYAQLQDDDEDSYRKKTRRGSERIRQSSSGSEEEEEESQDSETDIEEELEESNKMPESEEGENEEEEVPAEQENEADQKMDMASVGEGDVEKDKGGSEDNDNAMDEQEEATEQESSPVSTSSSHDKDSSNTPMESEVEAQLSVSPDLPASNDSPAKAESDDEQSEEQEACVTTTTNAGDQMEDEGHNNLVLSPVDDGLKEVNEDADEFLNCKENTEQQKSTEECLLSDTPMSSVEKDNSEQDGEDGTEPRDDLSCEGDDGGIGSDPPGSPVLQEDSCTEEPSERRASIDSEDVSVEEKPVCTDTAGNDDDDDDDDDDPADDTATSGDEITLDSPVVEHQDADTNVHTEAGDLDRCENEINCELSPFGSSNGVHVATKARSILLNRLKLKKEAATHRDSYKPKNTEEDSPPPNRKRKNMSSENCTKNNGLTRYNGKEYTEDLRERNCKRAKIDCSYTSLSSSSDSDSDIEEGDTPGLMMTCSPRETPTKPNKKSHVSTQYDPDEVIVLSD